MHHPKLLLTLIILLIGFSSIRAQKELQIVHRQIDSLSLQLAELSPTDTLRFKYLGKLTVKYAALMDDSLYNVYAEKYYDFANQTANKKFLEHYYQNVMKHIGYNNPDLFRQRYKEAIALFSAKEDSARIGYLKLNKANFVRIMESDFDGSVALVEEVIEQFQTQPTSGVLTKAYLTLGMITEQIGQCENALQYLTLASASIKDCELAEAFERKGNCFIQLNELDSALIYTNKSLVLYQKLLDLDGIPATTANLGKIYLAKGDFRIAKNYFQKFESLTQLKHTPLAESYQKIGNFYFENNELDSAQIFLTKSLNRNKLEQKKYKNKPLFNLETHHLLSQVYAANGQADLALAEFQKYHFFKDSLNKIETNKTLETLNVQYETKEKEAEIVLLNKEKELLQARNKFYLIASLGGVLLASLFLFFYLNIRKKNQVITEQRAALAQLNTTKDQLFAIIGHDLRKPALAFRGISKKVNYLIEQEKFDALNKLGESLDIAAFNLNSLLDNLLNWALQQRNILSYNPKAIDVAKVTEEVQHLFVQIAREKGVAIELDIQDVPVYSDVNAFSTIVRNLLDNAIKFTPKGGKISLSTQKVTNGVLLKISDTGIGIPDEKAKVLFSGETNKSTKGTDGEKGSGIGLSLVRALVELNKGSIKVQSFLNRGTTFEVVLPSA